VDGRLAVSASHDKTLKVWDLETGRELRTLSGHSGEVWGVAVSGDGRRAVSASSDRTLRVWDLETGAEVATFSCDGAAHCCAFAGERMIVAGDAGSRVHFLALELGELDRIGPENGPDSEQTLAHLEASAVSLEKMDNRAPNQGAEPMIQPLQKAETQALQEEQDQIKASEMELGEHLAELRGDVIPALTAWFAFALVGLVVLSGSWWVRVALAGVYAAVLAYPVLCAGLWRFAVPGLNRGKEQILVALALVLSAPVLWGLHFLFYPVDAAWFAVWPVASHHLVLNLSKIPFLAFAISYFFSLRAARSLLRKPWIRVFGALIYIPLLVPALVSALVLSAALALFSIRTLTSKFTRAQALDR
jgi:Sec-independent protein secretion pathway component TatC